jgi:hypothetical protein
VSERHAGLAIHYFRSVSVQFANIRNPRLACFGSALPLGEVARPAATTRWPSHLVENSSLSASPGCERAGCAAHVTPHRLRHSFATEMLRLGVSLPALMQLLGHKDIRMTLRYVQALSRTCCANSTRLARMSPIRIACPRSRSPKISPAPVSPRSVRRWRQHVIFWRCIAAS